MSEHESPATEADIAESAMLPNAVLPLTDPDRVVDRVRQGLLNSLGSSEDFSDFKSMDEWELVN